MINFSIFGSFFEHLGRTACGEFQLDHRMVTEPGIRRSVLEMVRMLNVPVMRCPALMGKTQSVRYSSVQIV